MTNPHPARKAATVEPLEPRALLAAGALDPTFGTGGLLAITDRSPADLPVAAAVRLPGGNALLATPQFGLARVNRDGAPDLTFGSGGLRSVRAPRFTLNAMAVDARGRVLVAGGMGVFRGPLNSDGGGVARLNADGSLDRSFATRGWFVGARDGLPIAAAYAVAPAADGGVLFAGYVADASDPKAHDLAVAKLTADGQVDRSFGRGGMVVVVRGSTDAAHALYVQRDGSILIAGGGGDTSGTPFELVKLRPDGSRDPRFGTHGVVNIGGAALPDPVHQYRASDAYFDAVAVRPTDGTIVAAGGSPFSGPAGGRGPLVVAAFSQSGAPDARFGAAGVGSVFLPDIAPGTFGVDSMATGLAALPGGDVLVAGQTAQSFDTGVGSLAGVVVARLGPDGAADPAFGARLAAAAPGDAALAGWRFMRDDALLVNYNGSATVSLLPLARGRFDLAAPGPLGIQPMPAGRTLLTARFRADGNVDRSYGSRGASAVTGAPQPRLNTPAGLVVAPASAGGADAYVTLEHDASETVDRVLPDGSLDPAFHLEQRKLDDNFTPALSALVVAPDGKVIVQRRTVTRGATVARYNRDGTLDATFGAGGVVRLGQGPNLSAYVGLARADGSLVVDVRYSYGTVKEDGADTLYALDARGRVTGSYAVPLSADLDYYDEQQTDYLDLAATPGGDVALLRRSNVLTLLDGTTLTPRASFGTAGSVAVPPPPRVPAGYAPPYEAMVVTPDGKFLLAGGGRAAHGGSLEGDPMCFTRLNADGTPDASFGGGGTRQVAALSPEEQVGPGKLAVDPAGNLLLSTTVAGPDGFDFVPRVLRLTPNGDVDHSFGDGGLSPALHDLTYETQIFGGADLIAVAPGSGAVGPRVITLGETEPLTEGFYYFASSAVVRAVTL